MVEGEQKGNEDGRKEVLRAVGLPVSLLQFEKHKCLNVEPERREHSKLTAF